MATDFENLNDPQMVLIQIGGVSQWGSRAELRPRLAGNDVVHFGQTSLNRVPSRLRTTYDAEYAEYIERPGGDSAADEGSDLGTCCFLHGENKRPGEIRRRQKCENLTKRECIRLGGTLVRPWHELLD